MPPAEEGGSRGVNALTPPAPSREARKLFLVRTPEGERQHLPDDAAVALARAAKIIGDAPRVVVRIYEPDPDPPEWVVTLAGFDPLADVLTEET